MREKGKRREEEGREEEEECKKSKGMECLELLYGILSWNCLEHVWNSCLG